MRIRQKARTYNYIGILRQIPPLDSLHRMSVEIYLDASQVNPKSQAGNPSFLSNLVEKNQDSFAKLEALAKKPELLKKLGVKIKALCQSLS